MSLQCLEVIKISEAIITIKEYNGLKEKNKINNLKKISFCKYCRLPSKKVIKCNKCKDKFCLNCLTSIEHKGKELMFCYECLSDFINKDVDILVLKNDNY